MNLNDNLTKRQEQAYDKALDKICELLGSKHAIALRIYFKCGREVTGETVRLWFVERRVPTHIAFALYELCDFTFDPLALCPWLAEYVTLKERPAASKG